MTNGPSGDPVAHDPAEERGGAAAESSPQSGSIRLRLDSLAWQELSREADRNGVSSDELASFAILYYLADVDSGRIARRISAYRGDE
jgi:hypothetical protein